MGHDADEISDEDWPWDWPGPDFPTEWLVERVSIQDAEEATRFRGIPFGYINHRWEALKASMLPEDELWRVDSGPESWKDLRGWRGYAVRRQGKVVACIWTARN